MNRFVDLTYVVAGKAEYTIDGVCHRARRRPIWSEGLPKSAVAIPDLMDCYSINAYIYDLAGREMKLPFRTFRISASPGHNRPLPGTECAWLVRDPGYMAKARAIFMLILQRYYQLICHRISEEL